VCTLHRVEIYWVDMQALKRGPECS
jgi:hypothetical protein